MCQLIRMRRVFGGGVFVRRLPHSPSADSLFNFTFYSFTSTHMMNGRRSPRRRLRHTPALECEQARKFFISQRGLCAMLYNRHDYVYSRQNKRKSISISREFIKNIHSSVDCSSAERRTRLTPRARSSQRRSLISARKASELTVATKTHGSHNIFEREMR